MTYYDFTLLHTAVVRQRRRFVELLISLDKSMINKRDRRYYSSSDSANSTFAPATIPHKHVKGATALHYACLVKDMDIAKMLLEAGADWDIKDNQGRIAEDLLQGAGDEEIKNAFIALRDAEETRRKEGGENKPGKDDKDKKKDRDSDSSSVGAPRL